MNLAHSAFARAVLAALALGAATPPAAIARPASVLGSYLLRSDNGQIKLVINSQLNTGACQRIGGVASDYFAGTVLGVMAGWYCPATGRMGWQVLKPGSGATLQSFTGNVSSAGSIFGGSLSVFGAGLRGEYNLLGGPL